MKQCSVCKQFKNLSEFYNSSKTKDKKYPRCKLCDKEARRLWTYRNPDRSYRSLRGRQLKFVYGITLEDYEILLQNQNGCCAICSTTTNTIKQTKITSNKYLHFAVDHNHNTGKIRGLLCNQCNRALGMFKDDPTLLLKALNYLKKEE